MSFSTPYSKKLKHRFVDMFDARGYTNTKAITFEDDISALEADDGNEKVRLLFFEVLKFWFCVESQWLQILIMQPVIRLIF